MDDLISRQAAIDAICADWCANYQYCGYKASLHGEKFCDGCDDIEKLKQLPTASDWDRYSTKLWKEAYERGKKDAQPEVAKGINVPSTDCISRQAAIDAIAENLGIPAANWKDIAKEWLKDLPAAQPEKETPKRVLWTGWKGYRDTRYKCPNCKKPVKNDDVYCHRCGQKLMFPHISFTDYVPGEKQETIVRWDDEE